jgi:rusticyanin
MEHNTKKKRQSSLSSSLSIVSLSVGGGIVIITVILLGGIIPSSLFTSYSLHMPGMMGTNMNGMQNMMTTQGQTVSVQQAIQMMHNTPSYAKVISHNNTIIFGSKNTNVLALAMGRDTAINLTAIQPPSYSKGDVFVIDGLINPTLVIPKGTSVQFTVINLDNDMNHNLAISSASPPYPYMAMMSSMSGMMSFLPPTNQGSAHEYSYTLTLDQSGNLWYLCTYPSHAQDGMYGKILVTG